MRARCKQNPKHKLEVAVDLTEAGAVLGVVCTQCKDLLLLHDGRSYWKRRKFPVPKQWLIDNKDEIKLAPINI